MVELVDTQVLGTCAARRGGSTPSRRTKLNSNEEFQYVRIGSSSRNLFL